MLVMKLKNIMLNHIYGFLKVFIFHKANLIYLKGPLTYRYNGRETIVGVVSWLDDCKDPVTKKNTSLCNGTFSVFARVTAQLDWIEEEMERTYDSC